MGKERLRPHQVAKALGMSVSWVYGHKHRIGYVQLGNAVRFEQSALEGTLRATSAALSLGNATHGNHSQI